MFMIGPSTNNYRSVNKQNNQYKIYLDNFQGPLDLLLHLIEKDRLNIYDIPIAQITEQYLMYLDEAKNLDLDIASEFLVMAADLLSIKAKMLLPKQKSETGLDEEGEDPREELVSKLIEYKRFKEIAKVLKIREEKMQKFFFRPIDESEIIKRIPVPNPVADISPQDLFKAFQIILNKLQEEEPILEVSREEIVIQDCIIDILEKLENCPEGLSFPELFSEKISKLRVVVTFMALLELIRLRKVAIKQTNIFGKIMIYPLAHCL